MSYSREYLQLLAETTESLQKEASVPWTRWEPKAMKRLGAFAKKQGVDTPVDDIYRKRPMSSRLRTAWKGPDRGDDDFARVLREHQTHTAKDKPGSASGMSGPGLVAAGLGVGAAGILGGQKAKAMYDKKDQMKEQLAALKSPAPMAPQRQQAHPAQAGLSQEELQLLNQYYRGVR
jgi:hypothetical protein